MRNKGLGKDGREASAVSRDSDIDLGEFMDFMGAKPTLISSGIVAFQLPAPSPAPNPMNPENIEAGDTVRLNPPHHKGWPDGELFVLSVGGRYGNKVFVNEIGYELFATCFSLVRKAKGG